MGIDIPPSMTIIAKENQTAVKIRPNKPIKQGIDELDRRMSALKGRLG